MKVPGDSHQKKSCYNGEYIESVLNKDYMREKIK